MNVRAYRALLPLVLLAASVAQAEESVRSTQEELRRRNLYFGDIDGRRSVEYGEAVRRYQQRKGFTPSGKEDADTLRSLGLLARNPGEAPPKELAWPEETVLKSDVKVNVAREAVAIASESGIAPEVIAPIAMREEARRKNHSHYALPSRPQPAPSAGGGSGPAAVGKGVLVQAVSQKQVLALVGDFLHAVSCGRLQDELALYADHVEYYGNGLVDRRIVEHLSHQYYLQWPSRSYRLQRVTDYRTAPGTGEISVTFQVTFSLKKTGARVKGVTQNTIVLNAATSSPRIVAIREQRVRE